MKHFMKQPCNWCPFRKDVDFKFSPERAEELAYSAGNPYNTFPCHKTAEVLEDDEYYTGAFYMGKNSKECHGFLALQIAENGDKYKPEGFEPNYNLCYQDIWEMCDKYDNQ